MWLKITTQISADASTRTRKVRSAWAPTFASGSSSTAAPAITTARLSRARPNQAFSHAITDIPWLLPWSFSSSWCQLP